MKKKNLKAKIRTKKLKEKTRHSFSFKEKVLGVVSQIPKGKTVTYKQVAQRVGSSKAYRAVGNILNKNFDSRIPCHRVIRSSGEIGGYNRGSRNKTLKLKKEKAL